MPDPNTMTIDECRDWLIKRAGWAKITDGNSGRWFWHIPGVPTALDYYESPIPETLDAAAEAMPDGWSIKVVSHRGNTQATAWPSRLDKLPAVVTFSYDQTVKFIEANSEILARFRLAVACCMADDAAKGER